MSGPLREQLVFSHVCFVSSCNNTCLAVCLGGPGLRQSSGHSDGADIGEAEPELGEPER